MTDTDFLVSVELYVSPLAAATLKKRSKADKRPVGKSLVDDSKKLREKPAWRSIGKHSDTGHWRSATCKLTEDGERCLLNIYLDESILFQTVYIHLLNQTDIRPADPSLFFRKQCIGVFSGSGQRWTANQVSEPIYLCFAGPDLCNAWLALLRSYAVPEIYGTWAYPEDGGAYRMWRQIDLSVIQAKNLAIPSKVDLHHRFPGETNGSRAEEPGGGDSEALDVDIYCEVHLNETLCGKTTIKKGVGSTDWHENFIFSDLPPFEHLDLLICRDKRLHVLKPSILGRVRIVLKNFRRRDAIDGLFPILHEGSMAGDLQVGELRLRIRVDEEIILPYKAYRPLLQAFETRNFLGWISDCETKLNIKTISSSLMSLAVAQNNLVRQIEEFAESEVDGTPASHQTLFRGNTVLTKVMELSMSLYGKAFLEASIGSTVRRLCDEKVAIEVDPSRTPKGMKDIDKNVDLLIHWCREFWSGIYQVRNECPIEMRTLFASIRRLVERRYPVSSAIDMKSKELPRQSVSAFCFLRFIVPALLHPHLFGLVPGLPSASVQRSLTLIAKVIQSLANLNVTVQKEEFMRGVKDWLTESLPAMIDYISVVSSPPNEAFQTVHNTPASHDRIHVVNYLRHRAAHMPSLPREAIPSLPYLLDTPRQLAIITSSVIRNSSQRRTNEPSPDAADVAINNLCTQCFKVEEEALRRVSQLATRIHAERAAQPQVIKPSPTSSPSRIRTRRRPSTAPSSSESEHSRRRMLFATPASPTAHSHSFSSSTILPPDQNQPHGKETSSSQLRHFKSPSTDSFNGNSVPVIHSTVEAHEQQRPKSKRILGLWWR